MLEVADVPNTLLSKYLQSSATMSAVASGIPKPVLSRYIEISDHDRNRDKPLLIMRLMRDCHDLGVECALAPKSAASSSAPPASQGTKGPDHRGGASGVLHKVTSMVRGKKDKSRKSKSRASGSADKDDPKDDEDFRI